MAVGDEGDAVPQVESPPCRRIDAVLRLQTADNETLGADGMQVLVQTGALLLLVVDLVGQVVGITFQEAAVEAEQVGLVEVEKDLELVVPCILVDLTMSVEALKCAAHEGVAEGEVLVQVLLAAADELEN